MAKVILFQADLLSKFLNLYNAGMFFDKVLEGVPFPIFDPSKVFRADIRSHKVNLIIRILAALKLRGSSIKESFLIKQHLIFESCSIYKDNSITMCQG